MLGMKLKLALAAGTAALALVMGPVGAFADIPSDLGYSSDPTNLPPSASVIASNAALSSALGNLIQQCLPGASVASVQLLPEDHAYDALVTVVTSRDGSKATSEQADLSASCPLTAQASTNAATSTSSITPPSFNNIAAGTLTDAGN